MNAVTVLHYGHMFVLHSIKDVPHSQWYTGGVCGWWSVKDIIAHLASFEHMLTDVLKSLEGESDTPVLQEWMRLGDDFGDALVKRSEGKSSDVVLADYMDAFEESFHYAKQFPVEKYSQAGLLTWYGDEYDLDDFLVYSFYGHKREHGAQIAAFRDRLT